MDTRTFVALALIAIAIGMAGHFAIHRKPVSNEDARGERTEGGLTLHLARTATSLTSVTSAFVVPVAFIWITGDARLGTMFIAMGASLGLCMLLPALLSLPFRSVRGLAVWRLMAQLSGVSSRGLFTAWIGLASGIFLLGALLNMR